MHIPSYPTKDSFIGKHNQAHRFTNVLECVRRPRRCIASIAPASIFQPRPSQVNLRSFMTSTGESVPNGTHPHHDLRHSALACLDAHSISHLHAHISYTSRYHALARLLKAFSLLHTDYRSTNVLIGVPVVASLRRCILCCSRLYHIEQRHQLQPRSMSSLGSSSSN